jgi:hypothetical protein
MRTRKFLGKPAKADSSGNGAAARPFLFTGKEKAPSETFRKAPNANYSFQRQSTPGDVGMLRQ